MPGAGTLGSHRLQTASTSQGSATEKQKNFNKEVLKQESYSFRLHSLFLIEFMGTQFLKETPLATLAGQSGT